MRTFEKIVCVEGFQNTILACLLDRFNNLMPDLDTFCHLVWNKIHYHWGLTTKTRVHRGRTAHSIDHVSRILPLTSLKECFYYFAKWLTGKETLFFNTSYNRTKFSYFFSVFSVRKRPLSSQMSSAGHKIPTFLFHPYFHTSQRCRSVEKSDKVRIMSHFSLSHEPFVIRYLVLHFSEV